LLCGRGHFRLHLHMGGFDLLAEGCGCLGEILCHQIDEIEVKLGVNDLPIPSTKTNLDHQTYKRKKKER